jgi:hypothetical protein
MEVILYSRNGSDASILLAVSRKVLATGARFHVFCQELKKRQIVSYSPATSGEAERNLEIYPWSHLISWPFGMLLETFREYEGIGPILMIEAEYFCNHPFDLQKFIALAAGHDLFTVGGRFEMQVDGIKMAFPSWEIAYVSRELFDSPEFASFVFSQKQSPTEVSRLHVEREFGHAFLNKAKIGAVVQNAIVSAFDPVAAGEIRPADVLE